jgi:hypothetical protein
VLKICKELWSKNEKQLKESLLEVDIERISYVDLVKLSINKILNNDFDDYDKWNIENITEIDNGDYQGTLLFLIPKNSYQPSEYEYLMTYIGYGSCSGCDILQGIQYNGDSKDVQINDLLSLCRHIISNIIKPYNGGWREDEQYKIVEIED